ncbi:glycoside hydrolase family 5 protein [Rhodopseudomonas sp. B29]|uniref:glycoside hydrolase family 5 protein n=1 Tax=Rhodopseudomonas sp. B29 TaxID=95607 RepID=UPI000349A58F|nr:cellulase family glycosylhydrolase [Rhodopseudomonas sp. B29]
MSIVRGALRNWSILAALTLFVLASFAYSDASRGDEFATASRMGRGVNILGYDGIWEGGIDAPFRLGHLDMIKRAGFSHVRINLFGFKFMDAADRLRDDYLQRLDLVVFSVISAGLIPVIDEHDTDTCQIHLDVCSRKLAAFWQQVAARYAGQFPSLVFELLNEPGGNMTIAQWNKLLRGVLAIVRAGNPDRTVIVAALNTPDAPIGELDLPDDDRRIIVTFHYYEPFQFTHQGAPWSDKLKALPPRAWGSEADKAKVTEYFDRVQQWSAQQRRPIYLGEFGVYEAAPQDSRLRWLSFVARTAESHSWPWAYWQFDHDFALFDTQRQRWHADMLRALIPAR